MIEQLFVFLGFDASFAWCRCGIGIGIRTRILDTGTAVSEFIINEAILVYLATIANAESNFIREIEK